MSKTKILELAQIQTADLKIAEMDFKVREPSTLEMITFREKSDTKEGGSKAEGFAYLFETCIFNPDMTKAFEHDEALAIAVGSSRVAAPLIQAIMQWVPSDEESKSPKGEAPVESSHSS